MELSKWRLPVADTILVYVPKLRFSSKYSDVLRSPHRLEICGGPDGRRVGSIATYTKKPGILRYRASENGDLPTLIKEFYVRSAVRAERTRAAHLLLRMSTGHSWCALTASPTKCSTHRFPSRSATQSHRMPLSGIKATRASASPQNNIICSFGGPIIRWT